MYQNMSVIYMAAKIEQQLIAARAEQAWRHMDLPNAAGQGGFVAGLAAILRHVRLALPGGNPVRTVSAECTPSAC
jgi:hypothetical protein